jgi:hypothetical protein
VEIDDQGKVVRSVSNADPAFAGALLMPYSLVVIPQIDRIVSTNSSMHDEDIFSGVTYQVWRQFDLKLLKTSFLDVGDNLYAHISPEEPRLGPDGSVFVQTLGCGIERITGVESSEPKSKLIYTFPGNWCGVLAGREQQNRVERFSRANSRGQVLHCLERQLYGSQYDALSFRCWAVRDLRPKGSSLGLRPPMYPYVALRGPTYRENSHALGISIRAKLLIFASRKRLPRGFDSHRPLHSQATPGHAGLQDWDQDIDPMGKSWESTLRGRRSHGLTYSRIAPRFTRTVTRSSSQKQIV